jgi:hypothetical protein
MRRAAARKREARRKKIERQIELGTVKTISWEEAAVRRDLCGEQLPEDILVEEPPPSPAERFLRPRIRGKMSNEQFDAVLKQALIELMASDTPMSPRERQWYGDGLRYLKSRRGRPIPARPWAKAHLFNCEIEALVRDGYTVAQAKERIVEAYNLASVQALDQLLRRHTNRLPPSWRGLRYPAD